LGSLVKALSTIRVAHPDKVDRFLMKMRVGEQFRRNVRLGTNPELIASYVNWLGLYAGFAYAVLAYPKLRDTIARVVFRALVECSTVDEYSQILVREGIAEFQRNNYRIADVFGPREEILSR